MIDNADNIRRAMSTDIFHAGMPFQYCRQFRDDFHQCPLDSLFLPLHFFLFLLSQCLEGTLSCSALGNPVVAADSLEREKKLKFVLT